MIKKATTKSNYDYIKETILLPGFDSACALKQEIRNTIRNCRENNWDLCGISNSGPVVALCFKRCI